MSGAYGNYQWLNFAFEFSRSVSFCRSFELFAAAAPLFVVSVLMYDGSDSLAFFDCGSPSPSHSSDFFHLRSSRHAFLRLFMNSGIPLMATQVVIELGSLRPGFSKAVSENSSPGSFQPLVGRTVITDQ